jgi:hypothetical protein
MFAQPHTLGSVKEFGFEFSIETLFNPSTSFTYIPQAVDNYVHNLLISCGQTVHNRKWRK